MKISEIIGLYIQLRTQKAAMKADYEAAAKPIQEKMDKIEAKILEYFNANNIDNSKTAEGTAYISTRSTVSVADRKVFLDFLKEKNEWELMEVRPSKSAVDQYRTTHDALPPGLNYSEERTVNIRKSP
jgi:hypothetical protein